MRAHDLELRAHENPCGRMATVLRAHEPCCAAELQTLITPSLLGQIKRVTYHFETIEIIFHMQLESASNSFWLERYSTLNTTLAQCVLYSNYQCFSLQFGHFRFFKSLKSTYIDIKYQKKGDSSYINQNQPKNTKHHSIIHITTTIHRYE